LEQVEKHPDSQRILLNAAQYLSLFDRKIGRELLAKAAALDPSDAQTLSRLAQSYEHERMLVNSPEERTALAQKALAIVVLAYLQSCAKFWKMGSDQLQAWTATVKGGGMPEFGGNLLY
jgi:hypothetical protein